MVHYQEQPPRFRWIPPRLWRVLMVLLGLGLLYRLVEALCG